MKTPITYLHGYDEKEQERLVKQALHLESYVYRGVDFSKCKKIIEVGSGVGAQTEILLKRFPHLQIDCVDLSEDQIAVAKKRLAGFIKSKQVRITHANAAHLPFRSETYDGAFICWFLEHAPDPVMILEEVKRVLASGGSVYCTEVFNQSFYLWPRCTSVKKYFEQYNRLQIELKGDPDIGPKIPTYLRDAGFHHIHSHARTLLYDKRHLRKRNETLKLWEELILSGSQGLLKKKKIKKEMIEKVHLEMKKVQDNPNSIFSYTFYQSIGQH